MEENAQIFITEFAFKKKRIEQLEAALEGRPLVKNVGQLSKEQELRAANERYRAIIFNQQQKAAERNREIEKKKRRQEVVHQNWLNQMGEMSAKIIYLETKIQELKRQLNPEPVNE